MRHFGTRADLTQWPDSRITIDFCVVVWDNGSVRGGLITRPCDLAQRPCARAHPVRVPAIVKGAELTVFSRRTARRAAPGGPAAPRRRSALGRVTARAVVPVAAVGGLAGLSLAAPAVTVAAPAAAHPSSARAVPAIGHPTLTKALTAPMSTTDCQAKLGIACYSPVQYRVAYNLNPLYKGGITGAGRTIVIVDSFGSPTIA